MSRTYVYLVLDESGSMDGQQTAMNNLVAEIEGSIEERSRIEGLTTFMGRVPFSNTPDVSGLKQSHLYREPYRLRARDGTALYDAIAATIIALQANSAAQADPDSAFLIRVFTDGGENASGQWGRNNGGRERLKKLIQQLRGDGRWTFTFDGPPGSKNRIINDLGLPEDNVREWEQTTRGYSETKTIGLLSTQSYFGARGQGQTQVETLYRVTPNLSAGINLNTLQDLSGHFKAYQVNGEEPIAIFVSDKTKTNYVVGSGYYQLTKREKVQASKNILIRKKGEKRVYGGLEARKVLGLPTDGKSLAIVTPGNHGDYDIFVQSKTVNRKLVRGTVLLHDYKKKVGDKPTWDHTLGGTR